MSKFLDFIKNVLIGDDPVKPEVSKGSSEIDEPTTVYDEDEIRKNAEKMIAESLKAEADGSADTNSFEKKATGFLILEEYEKALDALDKALLLDKNNFDACRLKADIYKQSEDFEKSLIWHNRVILLHPLIEKTMLKNRRTFGFLAGYDQNSIISDFLNRADIHLKLENVHSAISDYSRIISIKPDVGSHYLLRGELYAAMDENTKALDDFNKSLELEESRSGYVSRAEIYAKSADFSAAIRDYTKAIILSENEEYHWSYYFERGEMYLNSGDYDLALADFTKAVEDYPDFPNAYRKRAEIYRKLGQIYLAEADEGKAEILEADIDKEYTSVEFQSSL